MARNELVRAFSVSTTLKVSSAEKLRILFWLRWFPTRIIREGHNRKDKTKAKMEGDEAHVLRTKAMCAVR